MPLAREPTSPHKARGPATQHLPRGPGEHARERLCVASGERNRLARCTRRGAGGPRPGGWLGAWQNPTVIGLVSGE